MMPNEAFHSNKWLDAHRVNTDTLSITWERVPLLDLNESQFHSRFSDKNQKAIDMLRTKCLKLNSLVLSDGKLYEIMRGNFERADRRSVIRTTINCRVTNHYLLTHYDELLFTWTTFSMLSIWCWSWLISQKSHDQKVKSRWANDMRRLILVN
jgi:hypothetical protein